MKKFLAFVLTLLALISLIACEKEVTPEDNKLGEVGAVTEKEDETVVPVTETEPKLSREIPQNFLGYDGEKDAFSANVIGTKEITKDKITSITFLDTLADMPADAWDASADLNGSVMAWVDGDGNLFIAGEGGVSAPVSCKGMFKDYYNAKYINFNNCFYTDLAEDMSKMFASSDGFRELDLSFFNTSNVRTMREMFAYCTCLNSVNLSSFDTSRVYDMREMFQMTSLDSIDVSGFNTSKVTSMKYMFDYCDDVTTLDLSNFDTSKVTEMEGMFNYCESLESLNVSSFNTSSVTNMKNMFNSCKKLQSVDLSGFDFTSLETADEMFAYSGKLADIGCTITLPEGCTAKNMYLYSGLE